MRNKIAMAALVALGALALWAEVSIEKQKELDAMRSRPCCISRKKIAVGGKDYIVEQWRNLPDGREWRTNEVFSVVGVQQPTSWSKVRSDLESKLAAAEGDAKAYKDLRKAVKKADKNISKVVKTIEKAKDKAESAEETELYDALLAVINGEDE